MSVPAPPPMLHYAIYMDCGRFDVVTDRRITFELKLPEWMEFKEYHFNVEKYYWGTSLRPVWIHTKRISLIKFIEYVKVPLGRPNE